MQLKLNSPIFLCFYFYFFFFNVATRKCKITNVAHVLFLLDSAALEIAFELLLSRREKKRKQRTEPNSETPETKSSARLPGRWFSSTFLTAGAAGCSAPALLAARFCQRDPPRRPLGWEPSWGAHCRHGTRAGAPGRGRAPHPRPGARRPPRSSSLLAPGLMGRNDGLIA